LSPCTANDGHDRHVLSVLHAEDALGAHISLVCHCTDAEYRCMSVCKPTAVD